MTDTSSAFEFEIVTPEQQAFSGAVERVDIPGVNGMFGVLANHAPLIAALGSGILRIVQAGQITKQFFIYGGFAEVTKQRCTVLATYLVDIAGVEKAQVEGEIAQLQSVLESSINEDEKIRIALQLKQLNALIEFV